MRRNKQAVLIADLGFGDAGKGTITDLLAEQLNVHTVVRYNGGPQAAHTVVTRDGRQHTFAQFSSGTFHPNVCTLLSRYMLVNPLNMLKEERHLRSCGVTNALQRMYIDRQALLITPFHYSMNRLRELARGDARHGSCGEGIGECMADSLAYGNAVLQAGDMHSRGLLLAKLAYIRDIKHQEYEKLKPLLPQTTEVQRESAIFETTDILSMCADIYKAFSGQIQLVDEADVQALFNKPGTILFEGAQGVLLDENFGFTPYTTWSTTTFANAQTLLMEHKYDGEILKVGVMRTYGTRHGAGPFPTEEPALTSILPEQHNGWNNWQQTFRVGYCDLVATRYAKSLVGELDLIALTHVDRLHKLPENKVCSTYNYGGSEQDLRTYFKHSGKNVQDIKVSPTVDLDHQEQLTLRVLSCTPEYQKFENNNANNQQSENAFISLLEEQLSTSIGIISLGPTAADKQCIAPVFVT